MKPGKKRSNGLQRARKNDNTIGVAISGQTVSLMMIENGSLGEMKTFWIFLKANLAFKTLATNFRLRYLRRTSDLRLNNLLEMSRGYAI